MTTRIVLVRHGQSSYNTQKRIQGRTDESVLTEVGIEQAQKVGIALKDFPFDAVYSSPLQRAKQTAKVIISCFGTPPPFQPLDSLMEIDLPLWEKLPRDEVKAKFPDDYRTWKERPDEFKMLIGETVFYPVLALFKQAQQFWQDILSRHQGGTILLVAHNGINRCLLATALGIPAARYHSIQQSNGGINVLNFAGNWGESVQLESLNQTSHLGEALPTFREEHQGLRVLLVRHGETNWNREGRFQGTIDVPLNETGQQQGQKAAEFLKDMSFDFAVSSPMLRPKETAEIILKNHPNVALSLHAELSEIGHGLWEGKLETEIEQLYPGELQRWRDVPEEVQMPEGENLQQVWERAIAAWNDIIETAQSEHRKLGLVVAHDAINKVIVCYLLGLSPVDFWKIKQGNGGVTVIDYPLGYQCLPVLQAINITTHLSGSILDRTAAGAL